MAKVWDTLDPRNLELGPVTGVGVGTQGMQSAWRHWKLARDDDGVAWLVLDKQGASANTLSEDVLTEFADVLGTLERDLVKGLIIRSGKRGGFIAGADISEMRGLTPKGAKEEHTWTHRACESIRALPVPVIARINGYCFGAGMELAASCDMRIGVTTAKFGMPERRPRGYMRAPPGG